MEWRHCEGRQEPGGDRVGYDVADFADELNGEVQALGNEPGDPRRRGLLLHHRTKRVDSAADPGTHVLIEIDGHEEAHWMCSLSSRLVPILAQHEPAHVVQRGLRRPELDVL